MKYITIIGVLILSTIIINAQVELSSAFNSTRSGRNVSFAISKSINDKNQVGGGLRININMLAHNDDQNKVFVKRLFATKPIHYFGLEGFYYKNILNKWDCVKPFLFYDIQAAYSTTWNRMLLPYTYDINGDVLYKEYREHFGPFTWVEQCIGIGFKANLIKSFFITQKIGFGTMFILGKDKRRLGTYDKFSFEFGSLISIGLGYRFKT